MVPPIYRGFDSVNALGRARGRARAPAGAYYNSLVRDAVDFEIQTESHGGQWDSAFKGNLWIRQRKLVDQTVPGIDVFE